MNNNGIDINIMKMITSMINVWSNMPHFIIFSGDLFA